MHSSLYSHLKILNGNLRRINSVQFTKCEKSHRLRATTSATINASSILTTADRVWLWRGPFIIVL